MSNACVYCLQNGHLRDEQVLFRGDTFYVCAPRGQLVEGFLVIAPYRCTGCLTRLPAGAIEELPALQDLVREFYARAYNTRKIMFYEQGRAGGGALGDPRHHFPFHAHLCSLPRAVDLHAYLSRRYLPVPVPSLARLATAVGKRPYLYVEVSGQSLAYVEQSGKQSVELEQVRLKPVIAQFMSMQTRGDWRAYPGDHELSHLIAKWRQHGTSNHRILATQGPVGKKSGPV